MDRGTESVARAIRLEYDQESDELILDLRRGATVIIPRDLVDELAALPAERIAQELVLSGRGEAIAVPIAQIDIAVTTLLRDVIGLTEE